MTLQMTVSPDFAPGRISGWYIFNTWLQKQLDARIHLELFSDFNSQRTAIRNDQIDIIYANPFDASMLIREKNFTALVRPAKQADEVVVVVPADSPANAVTDLTPGVRLVFTNDPDVQLIGMIMLEPADLNGDNLQSQEVDSYPVVAKRLLRKEADAGFFLKEAFDALAPATRENLKVLAESQISVIHHALLVGPRLAERREEIRNRLLTMTDDAKGASVMESLGLHSWQPVDEEDAEFMIDLMDTLS